MPKLTVAPYRPATVNGSLPAAAEVDTSRLTSIKQAPGNCIEYQPHLANTTEQVTLILAEGEYLVFRRL